VRAVGPQDARAASVGAFEPSLALGAPPLLCEFNRAGVLDAADVHVARALGRLAGEDDEQVLLAAALAVRGVRLGHVLVALDDVAQTVATEADAPSDPAALPWPEPQRWLERVKRSPLTTGEPPRPLRLEGSALYLRRCHAEEEQVARALRRRARALRRRALADGLPQTAGAARPPAPERPGTASAGRMQRLLGDPLTDRQALAVQTALGASFSVIAGGPGTGKTTAVARVVALAREQALAAGRPVPLVALCAPTGRAAARLEEAVHAEAATLDVEPEARDWMLSLRAQTLHRLLGLSPHRTSPPRRLAHDLVIVDETSMVGLSLMASLTEALRPAARLVLVGDPDQLASVEAGSVLADIVAGTDPAAVVALDRVHRFEGEIAQLAEAIRDGDGDAVIDSLARARSQVSWLDCAATADRPPDALLAPALDAALETIAAARAGDAQKALRSSAALRVLCAHRRGPYGAERWSELIESRLRAPEGAPATWARWYPGLPLLVSENDPELRLANGDLGVVVSLEGGGVACAFARGDTTVLHGPGRLGAVQTSYAATIHRSQGSQFDTALVVLPEPGSRLLTRELLYTAVTRARRRLVVAGEEEAIRLAVARRAVRASGLAARLRRQAPGAGRAS